MLLPKIFLACLQNVVFGFLGFFLMLLFLQVLSLAYVLVEKVLQLNCCGRLLQDF